MYRLLLQSRCIVLLMNFLMMFGSCEFKETIVLDEDGGGKVASRFFGEKIVDIIESLKEECSEIEWEEFSMQEFIEENKEGIDSLSPKQRKEIYDLADSKITIQNKDGYLYIHVGMDFELVDDINKKFVDSRRAIGYWLNESPFPSEDEETNKNASLED